MALNVIVSVLYDNDLNYFPGGKAITIPADSTVVGTKLMPDPGPVPGVPGYPTDTLCLIVKTKTWDAIYLNMTLAQYNAAVAGQTTPPAGGTASKCYNIPADQPAGVIITDPALLNATLLWASVNGIEYTNQFTLVNSGSDGVATWHTVSVGWGNGDVVCLLYSK